MNFKYNSFTIPVLSINSQTENVKLEYNNAFENLFLKNKKVFSSSQSKFKDSIINMVNQPFFHWNGILYQVNKLEETNEINSYFISPSENSVALSFLWMKHDLINILNPIIGFSDILIESKNMEADDAQLIEKIRSNSQKFYEQIQKIAALQLLTLNQNGESNGVYSINDFLLELNNKLKIEGSIEQDISFDFEDNYQVNSRIGNPDFRFAFEEHFAFLNKHQTHPNIDIKLETKSNFLVVTSTFSNCFLSSRQIEDLKNVEHYIKEHKPINRLQSDPLNYLLLNELLSQIGGNCEVIADSDLVDIIIYLPIIQSQKKQIDTANVAKEQKVKKKSFVNFPPEIVNELSKICSEFHGFMILDDWEKLSTKIANINKTHQDTNLELLINKIDLAVSTFDVEQLKEIYKNCQFNFNNKNQ